MATLRINDNETFVATVTCQESDKYTKDAYVKFERHDICEDIRGCNELFLSPDELETLGKFLVNQAEVIRRQQEARDLAAAGLERL
jgi:hypothetical protein